MSTRDDDDWLPSDDDAYRPVYAAHEALTPVPYSCAACGEINETELDLSGGFHQQYVEDCAVCCQPNVLRISVDEDTLLVTISNELEGE